jgi:hypothetical protein
VLPQDVDAQCYGWIGVAKPGSDDVYWDTGQQQSSGVQVAQIMQATLPEAQLWMDAEALRKLLDYV